MWIIRSHSRNRIWKMFKIFIEKSFLSWSYLFAFHRLESLLNLLICFVQIVITWSWFFSIFLLHFNSLDVCVFNKTLVDFIGFSFFAIGFLIERIFKIVVRWLRNLFHDFKMIIHIKTSSCFVFRIRLTFDFLFVFSFSHLLYWVNIFR